MMDLRQLQTKRLTLTPKTNDELRAAVQNEQDEHMQGAYRQMLTCCLAEPANRLWFTDWSVTLRDSGAPIGGLGYKGPPKNGEVELGYGIDEAYRGQGYAAEAARALIRWAFRQKGVFCVMAEAEADNRSSLRVLEKLGFQDAHIMGEEGPRFALNKPKPRWTLIGLAVGLLFGLLFGFFSNRFFIGLCVGLLMGLAVGAPMDANANAEREKARSPYSE